MPPIDSVSQLTSLLRAQVTGLRLRGRPNEPAANPGKTSASSASPSAQATGDGLIHYLVAQRVQGIAMDDPQRKRKTFRIFLESVLLQELGMNLIGDSGFQQVVEEVLQRMESDDELHAAMQEASTLLLEQAEQSTSSPT
jgi:hypothetical protein